MYISRTIIINKLRGKIARLSVHKHASNVVEKCLEYGTPSQRLDIINEMLAVVPSSVPSHADQVALCSIVIDQYGNYVVQKTLEVSMLPPLLTRHHALPSYYRDPTRLLSHSFTCEPNR